MKNLAIKKINIPINFKIFKIIIVGIYRFIILLNVRQKYQIKYIYLPIFVGLIKKKNNIYIYSTKKYQNQTISFLKFFSTWFQKSKKIYTRIFILKGLGLKMTWNKKKKLVVFKLGYSHKICFNILKNKVFFKLKKTIKKRQL